MKIVTTSNLGLTILLGCTLGMGAIGWYGSQRLADLLSYVPGCRLADGRWCHGGLHRTRQPVALYPENALGIPLDAPELQRAKRRPATLCTGWSKAGSSMGGITTLKQHEQTYQQEQAQLLTLYRTFTSADEALRASSGTHVTPLDQAGGDR